VSFLIPDFRTSAGGHNTEHRVAIIDASRLGPKKTYEVNVPPIDLAPLVKPPTVSLLRAVFSCVLIVHRRLPCHPILSTLPPPHPNPIVHPALNAKTRMKVDVIPPGRTIIDLSALGPKDAKVVKLPYMLLNISEPIKVLRDPPKITVSPFLKPQGSEVWSGLVKS